MNGQQNEAAAQGRGLGRPQRRCPRLVLVDGVATVRSGRGRSSTSSMTICRARWGRGPQALHRRRVLARPGEHRGDAPRPVHGRWDRRSTPARRQFVGSTPRRMSCSPGPAMLLGFGIKAKLTRTGAAASSAHAPGRARRDEVVRREGDAFPPGRPGRPASASRRRSASSGEPEGGRTRATERSCFNLQRRIAGRVRLDHAARRRRRLRPTTCTESFHCESASSFTIVRNTCSERHAAISPP